MHISQMPKTGQSTRNDSRGRSRKAFLLRMGGAARTYRACAGVVLVMLLSACASGDLLRDPVPEGLVNRAVVDNLEGIRYWGDAPSGTYRSIAEARIAQLQKEYGASALKGKRMNIESLSLSGAGLSGEDSICRGVHARQIRGFLILSGCRDTERETGMRFTPSILTSLLKPIDRRQFAAIVERFKGDAYDKSFTSWDHLVALICAQLNHASSLRALVLSFNTNSNHHYHLGVGQLARSTLADANARRPPEVFAGVFAMLAGMADRQSRREGAEMIRLIDSSPIPLGKICDWAKSNGRIRGMKMHVVYDPKADVPSSVEVTQATVNDVEIGRQTPIEAAATYVFDKGYCRFDWWVNIHEAKAFFVTRPKTNTRLRATKTRRVRKSLGDGFRIIDDAKVKLASKGDSKLDIPLRRIRLKTDTGKAMTLITNDLKRSAIEIANLYKARWQIELLFRWIKQHLHIRKFLGTNENAIRLQIIAAMIAYLLLRIAASLNHIKMPALRFAELISQLLFSRRTIALIHKPPPINPSRRQPPASPLQMDFAYA